MQKLTVEIKTLILKQNSEGLTNRAIAKNLGLNHRTIGDFLKKENRQSSWANQKIDIIDENYAKCSKCNQIKDIIEFQRGRKNQNYEYRFSYCNICRKKQVYDNLNKDFQKYFKDRYNRWKRQAKATNIPFTISFDDIMNMYKKQEGKCFYTDIMMDWGVNLKDRSPNIISIDKVIPELGYVKNNIVLCSNRANTIKSNQTMKELKMWMPEWHLRLTKVLQVAPGDF